MDWFTDRHFFLLAVIVYGFSVIHTVFLWRKGFRQHNHTTYLLLLLAFCLHTVAMVSRGVARQRCPVSNLYEATSFLMWTIVAVYLVLGLWSRVRFLGAFASPVLFGLGVFALMPGLDAPPDVRPEFPVVWTSVHAALLALAYGAFGLSFVAAVMYLIQERNLKQHKVQAIFSLMPPIQRLESVVGRTLVSGFILLSVGLAIGAYSLTHAHDVHAYRGDLKIIWSAVVWLMYLGLIIMRWYFSQAGRRFALGAIGSFVFVLLTFWGTNALSPLHHP